MSMKPQVLAATLIAVFFAGALPAADTQLLGLAMPNAKVLAGVNVDQAKSSAFGQYVLAQLQAQDAQFQQLIAATGFDPRTDVHEILFSADPAAKISLVLARGRFDPAKIAAAAQVGGAVTETYKGVTIVEDVKHNNHAVAFLDSTLAAAGDIPSVKGAIDRQTTPAPLSAPVMVQVNQWSLSQDAWALTEVPPSSLKLPNAAPNTPGAALLTAFQNVQQAAGGIKFGTAAVVTAQAQTDTAQNATALAGVLQFLASFAQTQAQQNPASVAFLKSLTVTATGNQVNLSATIPESQLEQLSIQPKAAQPRHRRPARLQVQ